MTKPAPHSTYQIIEDAMLLVGSFAQLGKTIAAHKIQSGAETANAYIHSKVDLSDVDKKFSSAAESLGNASDYALHTDVKHMVDDASAFARKHPLTTLISVVAVGAMFSSLLRRSEPTVAKAKSPKAVPKPSKQTAKPRSKANGVKHDNA